MDEIVALSMAKWPNVPAVYGWLQLDRRGNWRIKGERVGNAALREFICRNYQADSLVCWFFQNGPQRVYVELEAAPWVWRLSSGGVDNAPAIASHTGLPARFESAWLDERGRLFLATDLGLGVVHTLDMEAAADAVEVGAWSPAEIRFEALPERFGYRLKPAPQR